MWWLVVKILVLVVHMLVVYVLVLEVIVVVIGIWFVVVIVLHRGWWRWRCYKYGWCWVGSMSWREKIEWGSVFFSSLLTLVVDRGHLVVMAV